MIKGRRLHTSSESLPAFFPSAVCFEGLLWPILRGTCPLRPVWLVYALRPLPSREAQRQWPLEGAAACPCFLGLQVCPRGTAAGQLGSQVKVTSWLRLHQMEGQSVPSDLEPDVPRQSLHSQRSAQLPAPPPCSPSLLPPPSAPPSLLPLPALSSAPCSTSLLPPPCSPLPALSSAPCSPLPALSHLNRGSPFLAPDQVQVQAQKVFGFLG